MARGSSYGGKPTEPSLTETASRIPRRATREFQAMPIVEDEPKTQVARPAKNKNTPLPLAQDFVEPETELAYVPKAKAASKSRKISETVPQYEPLKPARVHALSRHHHWLRLLMISFGGVLVGAIVLVTAALYMRGTTHQRYVNFSSSQSFPIQLGGSFDAFNLWNNSTGPIPTKTPLPTNPGPYSVLGKPTITAAFINQVLASYHSPTSGMGQDLYDLGVKYGIDPVYPLAFFMHESLFGTTGEARATLSLGNSRCIPDRACINTAGTTCQDGQSCYAKMNSWADGFEQWYKLIRNLYVAQWGRVTVDQIIPKYAPNSDGNDEAEYIATLKHTIDVWRSGTVRV